MSEVFQILRSRPAAWPENVTLGFSALVPGGRRVSLGFKQDPTPAEVLAVRESWLRALGFDPGLAVFGEQVHEGAVASVGMEQAGFGKDTRETAIPGVDGLISQTLGQALSVTTADCLPVLMCDAQGRAVAAVHAGWRSLAAQILAETVRAFEGLGIAAGEILAVLGPCISGEVYEVGEEFSQHFPGSSLPRYPSGKLHLNLKAEATRQLLALGLDKASIAQVDHCTFKEENLFFSNRRDGGVKGLLLSTVGRV